MPRADIWVGKDNWPDYQKIPKGDKSGLVNSLLARHFKEIGSKVVKKQDELFEKDIISDVEIKTEGNKIKATVIPNAKKTKEHIKAKYGTTLSMKVPKNIKTLIDPGEACPHGYAVGMCKYADCNKRSKK